MLFILNNPDDNVCFYLTEYNKEYVVGRKDCEFLIDDDASVSRNHAVIRIRAGSAILRDCGAKYKTFHNGKALQPSEEVHLNDGDDVQFGIRHSKFKFQIVTIQTTGSRLNQEQNQQVRKAMGVLKGSMVDVWDSKCTHLTVHELMLSVKVLHAILDEKPIVSDAYWNKYLECFENNKSPPPIDKLKPRMAEALLSSVQLKPDSRRKTLFSNKVFVFATEKARSKMEDIIKKAGGTCVSWQKTPLSIAKVSNTLSEYVILQGFGESPPDGLVKLTEHLKKQGKRPIPVQEIAMAIVLCSVEKDCNPSFQRAQRVFNKPFTQLTQPGVELAKETETQNLLHSQEMRRNRPNIVIDSSLDATMGLSAQNHVVDSQEAGPSSKRQQDQVDVISDHQLQPPKRIKQEVQQPGTRSVNPVQTTLIAPKEVKSEIIDVDEYSTSTDISKHGTKRKSEESPVRSPKKKDKMMINPFSLAARKNKSNGTDPFAGIEEKIEVGEVKLQPHDVFAMVDDAQFFKKEDVSVLVEASPDLPNTLSSSKSVPAFSMSARRRDPASSVSSRSSGSAPSVSPRSRDPASGVSARWRDPASAVSARSTARENPSSANQNGHHIMSSTMNQQPPNQTLERINISRIARDGMARRWLRKGVVVESGQSHSRENMDPDQEAYCRSFRDCVVIKPMEWYPKMDKKPVVIPDSLDGNVTKSVPNFKKFKKVRPLRPQTVVIHCPEPVAAAIDSQQGPPDSEGYMVDDPAPASRRRRR